MKHLKFFVGHKKPNFTWDGFEYIGNSSFESEYYSDLLKGLSSEFLSDYYALFSLRHFLEKNNAIPDLITICQYRRFVINVDIGKPFQNAAYCNQIHPDSVENINLKSLVVPTYGQWLFGKALRLNEGIIGNYSHYHILRDLLHFITNCIDANIIDNQIAYNILTQKVFIPAPSVGTYPGSWFINSLRILEAMAFEFYKNGFIARDGYQKRSIGFILERVLSCMIFEELKKYPSNQIQPGVIAVLSEQNVLTAGG